MTLGNPGVAQYYADFIQELYKRCHLPVCCVSHAGHVTVHQPVLQCKWRLLLVAHLIYSRLFPSHLISKPSCSQVDSAKGKLNPDLNISPNHIVISWSEMRSRDW